MSELMEENASDTDSELSNQENSKQEASDAESTSLGHSTGQSSGHSTSASKSDVISDDRSSDGAESDANSPPSDEETKSDSFDIGDTIVSETDSKGEETSVYADESLAGLGSYLQKIIRHWAGRDEQTGFVLMLACLRECLLTHRWQEASQAVGMICLYPTHQFDDYIWKCGLEVLYNHPDSDPAVVEHFTSKMEGIYVQRRRKRLEKAFYLLSRGQTKDAQVAIQSARVFRQASVRKGDQRTDQYWKLVTRAYTGMLKYMECRQALSAFGTEEQQEDRNEFTVRDACEDLGCALETPGVWDIFVAKQVELLETDGKLVEAREALETYCAHHRDNPNAHRYLYRFLKRTHGDQQEMIRVLKEYIQRIPSDILALDLVSLLKQSAQPETPSYSGEVGLMTSTLFNMLDHSCWYKRLAPWKALSKHLTTMLKKRDLVAIDAVKACWRNREWWSSYHFDIKVAKKLLNKNKKVALHKAVVMLMLTTGDSPFVLRVRKHFSKNRDKTSLKQLDRASRLARRLGQAGIEMTPSPSGRTAKS